MVVVIFPVQHVTTAMTPLPNVDPTPQLAKLNPVSPKHPPWNVRFHSGGLLQKNATFVRAEPQAEKAPVQLDPS